MTERVKKRLEYFNKREYRSQRNTNCMQDITKENEALPMIKRRAKQFSVAVANEIPLLYDDDIIGFNQYCTKFPYDASLIQRYSGNLCIDFETFLKSGLIGLETEIQERYPQADEDAKEFYDTALECISSAKLIVKKYRNEAKKNGNQRLYDALCIVPENGAQNYYQALISIKFIQYILRLDYVTHITLGRFDQYAKPYFDISKKNGATDDELLELTELFFLALNFDSDIYIGMQTGDNGQSMMLGGCDKDGKDVFNELSEICLKASEELCLIDPKINLRVNKNTDLSLYERGTRLTKQGLGFPQYSNDDVVIPGLIALGYDEVDARNYTVAACWEFIIPRCGADTPNMGTMNFPLAIERATERYLSSSKTYAEFSNFVEKEIVAECENVMQEMNSIVDEPDAFLSLFILPCIKRGKEFSKFGAKYNNYGMHGAGLSTAADALEAIEKAIYIDKIVSADELIKALKVNFVGYENLQKQLLSFPKMGNNEESVDKKAAFLMDIFTKTVNNKPNNRGGIWRAGTGSAMEYILSANKVGATADGRKAKEPYASSFSPALTTKLNGPLSAIMSFTKYDMQKIINGGPFTIEIHDTVFRNEEGEKKVAMLVKSFIDLGGHQMQINAVNRERLLDAQKNPDKHANLIVRVWGWSGYFNELNVEYQNHIIRRMEFGV